MPPGYDWPTHGGYLGCLLGVIASCLLAAFFGSTLFAALRCSSPISGDTSVRSCHPLLPAGVTILLTVAAALVLVVALGRLGFALGKRYLREYPQPQGRTWGEHDDAEAAAAPSAAPSGTADPGALADTAKPPPSNRTLASQTPQEHA